MYLGLAKKGSHEDAKLLPTLKAYGTTEEKKPAKGVYLRAWGIQYWKRKQ